MDLRTKLIFALVAVSLGSMLVLGLVVEPRVAEQLRDGTLAQLDELAEAKRESLGWIIVGWRDRVDLVGSHTQLRAGLDDFVRTGSRAAVATMERTLADALEASETLTLLRVQEADGYVVASATRGTRAPLPARTAADSVSDATRYVGVEFVGDGPPQVSFVSPLVHEGLALGTLVAVFEATELVALTGHSHDLGETGELLIVARDAAGAPRTLHPTRHDGGGPGGIVLPDGPSSIAARALEGISGSFWGDVVDYRGQAVWAATRLVPETGWGVIVKVDETEQRRPAEEFAAWLRRTSLVLAAFAILAGAVLGMRFAAPVQAVAGVADRIRSGDMKARATVSGEDEVGVLARAFNEMAEELEEQMTLLADFRKFFDVSIDLMCIASVDGYFKNTNPAFERELGWSREALLGKPFIDLVHPDDVAATLAEVAKLAQGIPTISFVNRYRCADGSWKRLRWATYPDESTGMLYAIAHVVDGTPRAFRGDS